MKPFTVKPLIKRNFFHKLLNLEPKKNFMIELNNLLAQVNSAKEISDTTIKELLNKYRLNSPSLQKYALPLFKEYINYVITNKKFDEKEEIKTLITLFDLPKEVYANLICKIILDYIKRSLNDGSWNRDDEKSLFDLAEEFQCNLSFDPETKQLLEDYRFLWQIEEGNFPIVSSPSLLLKKNEQCYWETKAKLKEWKKEVKSYSFGGPVARFRVAKGIYLTSGKMRVYRETREELKGVDSGILCITSERVIFRGMRRNITVRYSTIIDIELKPEGIYIHKTSGKPLIFDMPEKRKVYLLLAKLLDHE